MNNDEAAGVGDFSCCFTCGALLRYRENMTLRRIQLAELDELEPDARQLLLRMAAARTREALKRG
jgi:hypothetical protein